MTEIESITSYSDFNPRQSKVGTSAVPEALDYDQEDDDYGPEEQPYYSEQEGRSGDSYGDEEDDYDPEVADSRVSRQRRA